MLAVPSASVREVSYADPDADVAAEPKVFGRKRFVARGGAKARGWVLGEASTLGEVVGVPIDDTIYWF